MAEVNDNGVLVDTLAEVLAELDADFLSEFGAGPNGIDLSAASYTGRQNPIIARRIVETQQLAADVVSALNLNNAQGRFLDFIGTLFGEPRNPPTRATIPARLYGKPDFLVGDRRVRYRRNGTIWRVPLGVTIEAVGYVDTDLQADSTGTALTDGTTIEAFQDGSDQWTIVDAAPLSFFGVESTGAYSAGTTVEGGPSYKARLEVAGRSSGTTTEDGIRRAIYRVAGSDAKVDNNRENVVNANGVPAKHTEVIVDQGTDADVAQAIYDSFSDSNQWYGSTTATAYRRDPETGELDESQPVEVAFTRAERIVIVWEIEIDTTGAEATLPANAASLVSTTVTTYTNTTLKIGFDVQPEEAAAAIRSALPTGSIPAGGLVVKAGILDGPAPATDAIVITSRQRARTDATPQSAEVVGTTEQPFDITAGDVLVLAVNGGASQSVTMELSDFAVISAATALEVATIINNRMTGFVAGVEGGALVIRSSSTGLSASVNVMAASSSDLLTALGLSTGVVNGNDGYVDVEIV